jgi:hypothetical protein
MKAVLKTQAVVGIVGPDALVEQIASELAARFHGIIVTGTEAVVVG